MGAKLGGGGGGGRYDLHQNSDINVTPFVDVMLVLLIIFMVSAPMATVSIKLDLPPPTNPPKDKKKPVFIQILKTGEIYIVTRKTSLDSLPGDLAAELGVANPRAEQVMVKAEADVDYGTFMGVLNRLEEAGYFKVGLISENIT